MEEEKQKSKKYKIITVWKREKDDVTKKKKTSWANEVVTISGRQKKEDMFISEKFWIFHKSIRCESRVGS